MPLGIFLRRSSEKNCSFSSSIARIGCCHVFCLLVFMPRIFLIRNRHVLFWVKFSGVFRKFPCMRHHVFLDQFSGGFLWRVPKFSLYLCLYNSRIHITTKLLLHIMRLLNIVDVVSILPKLLNLGNSLREYWRAQHHVGTKQQSAYEF